MKLLGKDRRHIKGFIINKFRGDADILNPGLDMIREKTAIPVIGVLPYFDCTGLPEEDGLALSRAASINASPGKNIRIVIVRLKYISNFTDFDALMHEPDAEVIFSDNPSDIENCDMVIIPGTKNTVKDLLHLRETGLDRSIERAYVKGIGVVGICGGYQMLGRRICDPHGVESPHREIDGIGLLDIETNFENKKTTCRVEASIIGDHSHLVLQIPERICTVMRYIWERAAAISVSSGFAVFPIMEMKSLTGRLRAIAGVPISMEFSIMTC